MDFVITQVYFLGAVLWWIFGMPGIAGSQTGHQEGPGRRRCKLGQASHIIASAKRTAYGLNMWLIDHNIEIPQDEKE